MDEWDGLNRIGSLNLPPLIKLQYVRNSTKSANFSVTLGAHSVNMYTAQVVNMYTAQVMNMYTAQVVNMYTAQAGSNFLRFSLRHRVTHTPINKYMQQRMPEQTHISYHFKKSANLDPTTPSECVCVYCYVFHDLIFCYVRMQS